MHHVSISSCLGRLRADRFGAGLLVVLLVLVAHGLTARPAAAYSFLCGRYTGSDPGISYRFYSVTTAYQDAFNQAQYAWDSTSAPGFFAHDQDNGDPMLEVRDDSYSWDDWARMSYDGCTFEYWDFNETRINFNTRTMNGLTAREKKIVGEHEAGHSYGLDHEYYDCTNPGPTVMKPGTSKFSCGGDGPWYDDVQGVKAKY